MGNFVRAYLRASTDEQDPARAKQALQDFADKHGLPIAKFYVEQASGNKLNRPKLNELLDDCTNGDILLLESIDRLSRLNQSDWQTLKNRLQALSLRLIVLDLPITHQTAQNGSEWLRMAWYGKRAWKSRLYFAWKFELPKFGERKSTPTNP